MKAIGQRLKVSDKPSRPAESAVSAGLLRRRTRRAGHCPRCNDTGSIWVVCPDAGAVRLACECGRHDTTHYGSFVDVGLATAFVACCGAAYLLF